MAADHYCVTAPADTNIDKARLHMWKFLPLSSHSQPRFFRNLLNPRLTFINTTNIAEHAREAATAFVGKNRSIQVGKRAIDLSTLNSDPVQAGAEIIRKIADSLPAVLGCEIPRYEIAAILCTQKFWDLETTALTEGLPADSPYRFESPSRTAINITVSDGKLLVHKTAYWHQIGIDGGAIGTEDGKPILETNVRLSFALKDQTSLLDRLFGDGSGRATLDLAVDYCGFETGCSDLKNFLLQHEQSWLHSLWCALSDIFGKDGYYISPICHHTWQTDIYPTRPVIPVNNPAERVEHLRQISENLFDQDRRVIAVPDARRRHCTRVLSTHRFGEVSLIDSEATTQRALARLTGPAEQEAIRTLTREKNNAIDWCEFYRAQADHYRALIEANNPNLLNDGEAGNNVHLSGQDGENPLG